MTLKYEVLEDPILVFIKNDEDEIVVSQPHHPEAENFAPWDNKADAEAWAKSYIEDRAVSEEAARVHAASADEEVSAEPETVSVEE